MDLLNKMVRSKAFGVGMIVEQKLGAPDLGKLYMHTNFDIGMGVTNTDLITYAGLYLPKE